MASDAVIETTTCLDHHDCVIFVIRVSRDIETLMLLHAGLKNVDFKGNVLGLC